MNPGPVPLRGIPELGGLALFLVLLGALWIAAMIWCALSCLYELARCLWGARGKVLHVFNRQKENNR